MSLQVAEPGSPSLEKAGAMPFEEKASFFARIWWVKYGNVKIEKEICFMGRRMPTRSRSFVVRWSLPLKDFVNAVLVKASKDGTEMKTQMLMGGIQSSTSFLHQSNKRTKHRMPKADRTVGLTSAVCIPCRQHGSWSSWSTSVWTSGKLWRTGFCWCENDVMIWL